MMLASIESFLGTIWFTALVGVLGYIVGSAYPVTNLIAKFKK